MHTENSKDFLCVSICFHLKNLYETRLDCLIIPEKPVETNMNLRMLFVKRLKF